MAMAFGVRRLQEWAAPRFHGGGEARIRSVRLIEVP